MTVTTLCLVCGEPVPNGAASCAACGTQFAVCSACNGLVQANARFCGRCGVSRAEESPWDEVLDRLRLATAGQFEVTGILGRGGMAAVYRAYDPNLERMVAIKVMSPGLMMGPGMIERFRQEARTMANLNHENIVKVFWSGHKEGLHFFVMPLVDGSPLDRMIERAGMLPLAVVQAITFQVAGALAYAHRAHIVHRDVKPANILLDAETGNAIVTDFGIAKVRDKMRELPQTMSGATVGTPPYMSPEQWVSNEVGDASDQYSLGIVVYEMLAARPPFDSLSLGAMMRAHTEEPVPPIAERRPDVPAEVAVALGRMLEKDPARRFPTVTDAARALGARAAAGDDEVLQQLKDLARRLGAAAEPHRPPESPPPGTRAARQAAEAAAARAGTVQPKEPVSLEILAPAARTVVGEPVLLAAALKGPSGQVVQRGTLTWESGDPAVGAVSPSGVFTGLLPGAVTVTARTADGVTASARFTVVEAPVARVIVRASATDLRVDERLRLEVDVEDARGTALSGRPLTWTSSDPKVVSVSAAGELAGIAPGTATLNATSADGPAGSVVITVRPRPAAAITLSAPPEQVFVGDAFHLTARVRDERGRELSGRPVAWSSGNDAVLAVSAAGEVMALATGTATVAVTCDGVGAEVVVAVAAPKPSRVVVEQPRRRARAGRSTRLEAHVLDARGRRLPSPSIRWTIQTPFAEASLDPATGVFTPRAPGRLTVVATSGGISGAAEIAVHPARRPIPRAAWAGVATVVAAVVAWSVFRDRGEPGLPAALAVTPSEATMNVGNTVQLSAHIRQGSGTARPADSVAWTSTAPAVATVSAAGLVTAVASGPAVIQGRRGTVTTDAHIRVVGAERPAARLELGGAPPAVLVGDTFSIPVTARDDSSRVVATPPLEWRSSRPGVATVSPAGLVTAVGTGSTVLTARSNGISAGQTIRVRDDPARVIAVAPSAPALRIGDSVALRATLPPDATGPVTWTSERPGIATVTAAGMVVARAPGSATVTASAGEARGTAVIMVGETRTPVATIVIGNLPASLLVHDSVRLSATARDARGQPLAGRAIAWRGDNPAVAEVTGNGLVRARTAGTVLLTAESEGQAAVATLTIVSRSDDEGGPGGPVAISAVAAGGEQSCAVLSDGRLLCWGNGRPLPLPVSTSTRFSSLSVGGGFACGLTGSGRAWCWGRNNKGQLGIGSTRGQDAPTLVTADLTFSELSVGESHTCGITAGGNLYCWGNNGSGQLGDGSRDNRTRPTQIRESQSWRQVVAGGGHSCGLASDGRAFCWGDGFSGTLGHGMKQNELEPVPVIGGLTFRRLTAGQRHTCGLTADGQAHCWGDNRSGQLGAGTREDAPRPVAVAGGLAFADLSAGGQHTCGVSAGKVYCWGSDATGQLGDRTAGDQTRPVAVSSNEEFRQVRAGAAHTCAVTRAGQLRCWGRNDQGQLGDGTRAGRGVPGPTGPR